MYIVYMLIWQTIAIYGHRPKCGGRGHTAICRIIVKYVVSVYVSNMPHLSSLPTIFPKIYFCEKKKAFRHFIIYTECCLYLWWFLSFDLDVLIRFLTLSWPNITQHHLVVYAKKKTKSKGETLGRLPIQIEPS